jgi:hypothetical protein
MGQSQNYVKGGGSHTHVPVPLNSKIELYRSNKKLASGGSLPSRNTQNTQFDPKTHRKIDWDIFPIN